jgi:hypothetical protein
MEFSLLARARVQFSDFGQLHLDGGDVWWALFITLHKAGLSPSEREIARVKASQMPPAAFSHFSSNPE